jgi:hypothetical protein
MAAFDKMWTLFINKLSVFGPDFIASLAILLVGIVAAFLLKKLAFWAVNKLHSTGKGAFGRLVSPGLLNKFAHLSSRLIFWVTIFAFLILTAEMFGVDVLDEWVKLLAKYIPNVLGGIVILVMGLVVSGVAKDFVQRTTEAAGLANTRTLSVVVYATISSITVLVAIKQVGLDVGFLTSVILVVVSCFLLGGTISFGIGSAPVVTNILSTYYVRKELKVGQNLEGSDFLGKVINISATSVILQTADGTQVIPSRRLVDGGFKIKNAVTG